MSEQAVEAAGGLWAQLIQEGKMSKVAKIWLVYFLSCFIVTLLIKVCSLTSPRWQSIFYQWPLRDW